jgi:hypothetical protein
VSKNPWYIKPITDSDCSVIDDDEIVAIPLEDEDDDDDDTVSCNWAKAEDVEHNKERKEQFVEHRKDMERSVSVSNITTRRCECKHDNAEGWKASYDAAYFNNGQRLFGTICTACSKRFVVGCQTGDNEIVVRKGKCTVYICVKEHIEDCRYLMCSGCWTAKFSQQGRPTRRKT